MSVTRLKRKHRKNIARANNKQHIIKELLRTPVLKNVDLEELKSRFSTPAAANATESVKKTATSFVDKVKEVADSVAHSDVVEKVKAVADSIAHSDVVEHAKEVIAEAAESVKEAVTGTSVKAENAADFDPADAVRKPVNEDGQEGEHPKPEIAL